MRSHSGVATLAVNWASGEEHCLALGFPDSTRLATSRAECRCPSAVAPRVARRRKPIVGPRPDRETCPRQQPDYRDTNELLREVFDQDRARIEIPDDRGHVQVTLGGRTLSLEALEHGNRRSCDPCCSCNDLVETRFCASRRLHQRRRRDSSRHRMDLRARCDLEPFLARRHGVWARLADVGHRR